MSRPHPVSPTAALALLLLATTLPLAPQPPHAPPPAEASALPPLPAGLTLPVGLGQTLRAGKTPVGTPITARTGQRVLLPGNLYLKRGAELLGTVTASTAQPATLSLRFTTLRYRGHTVPLTARTLAVAAFFRVSDTFDIANGSTDRANSNPANWTTRQIGGDEVARTQWTGPVLNTSSETVGFADFHGVYANPIPPSTTPRALGPFSTSSHGLTGYDPDCTLQPTILTQTTTIQCTTSSLTLRQGDALLLEVLP